VSVRYPIAANAEEALKAPKGRAVREREASALAGHDVAFTREYAGPAFATRAAAEAAYAGRVDAEAGARVAPEDRFCELIEVIEAEPKRAKSEAFGGQAEPVNQAGRRWPQPKRLLKTVWRLSIGYWKIVDKAAEPALRQAREARRSGEAHDAAALRAMARQPLAPVKPQQPLDIGLFEMVPPEAPHLTIPDE
jgi:hypothetical protein